MTHSALQRRVIVGVDTHKEIHVAVAIDELGALIGTGSFTADRAGYTALISWATSLGVEVTFGVEGTGSYGAGLASAIRRSGIGVLEVLRTDRRDRRLRGKSDALDAENAARSVLAGSVYAVPKSADGIVEMIRVTKVAKDNAVKARTSAMLSLKQLLVNADDELRQSFKGLPKMTLIRRAAALRPGPIDNVTAATKQAIRAIAVRWLALDEETKGHDLLLTQLTTSIAPDMVAGFGIGPDVAAELLIVLGDNPARIHSEAAFARLCGTNPIPASSGKTTRYRLNRGGHRQANSALYRTVVVRMQYHEPTKSYVERRTEEGKTKPEIIRCLKRLLAREIWARTETSEPQQALDSYGSDNALAETINGLYKTEVIRHLGPWHSVDQVEHATAEWVDWFNTSRLFEYCGDIPPVELEQAHYHQNRPPTEAA